MCVRRATNGLLNVPSATRCDVWWLIGPSLSGGPPTVCRRDRLLQSIKGRDPPPQAPTTAQALRRCNLFLVQHTEIQEKGPRVILKIGKQATLAPNCYCQFHSAVDQNGRKSNSRCWGLFSVSPEIPKTNSGTNAINERFKRAQKRELAAEANQEETPVTHWNAISMRHCHTTTIITIIIMDWLALLPGCK